MLNKGVLNVSIIINEAINVIIKTSIIERKLLKPNDGL